MSDFPTDDLSQEINRLWTKVSPSSAEPEAFLNIPDSSPLTGKDLAWEAVALLKRRHTKETRYWAEVLEARERGLALAKERQARLELELNALRLRLQEEEASKLQTGLALEAQVKAAFDSVDAQRQRMEEELAGLRAVLEQTRRRLVSEEGRYNQESEQWRKREQQHLLDLGELQARCDAFQNDARQSLDRQRRLEAGMKEAKNAIEKTLAELLRERQVRADAERERAEALRKVSEVEKHFDELSKAWEEERAQWRQLWDRERSTWEGQRSEFASWEENLRKEREAWLAEVQGKEQDQLRFTEQISRSLRESSEATSRITTLMRTLSADAARRAKMPPWAVRTLAAAVLSVACAYPAWRYATRYHFAAQPSQPVASANPTTVAYDGALLWVADWDGSLRAFDPQDARAAVRRARVDVAPPYRPVGLAFDGEYVWSADAAQARIVRHRAADPRVVVSARPSPGPAPTALAYDGRSLWSYDAANKALYRHGSDESTYRSYALDPDLVVTGMAWTGADLWVFDSKSRAIVIFTLRDETFRFKARYELPGASSGLAVSGLTEGRGRRRLWLLGASSGGPEILRWSF